VRPTRRDLLLAAFAAALSGCTILLEAGPHDEGLMLAAAERIADGQVPYRDFWWNYGPGQPYLLGAITALSAPSLLAWRIVRVLVDVAITVLVARTVARDHDDAGWWPTGAGVAAAAAMAWPAGPGPGPPALALALAALLLAGRRPQMGGALAGVAGVVRPEIGLAAALGALVLAGSPRARAGSVATFAGVIVLGYGPVVLAAPDQLWDQTAGFLAIQDLQRLPFPFALGDAWPDPNKLLEAAFPAVLAASAVACGAWIAIRRRAAPDRALALLALLAVGVAYLLARTDEFHLVPLAVVVVAIAGLAGAGDRSRVVGLVSAMILGVVAVHGIERQAGRLVHPGDLARLPGPAADGVRADPGFARGVRALASRIDAVPGPVLVAPPRFDRVRFGAPLVNVLLQRRSPSRYDVMQPGVVTTAAVQREIAGDLRRTRTPWVVRWRAPSAARREPNGSGRSSGVTLLDRAIARDYVRVWADDEFALLRRRPGAAR
jgi:hypothetical protein